MTKKQIEATHKAARKGGVWHLPDCERDGCGHHPDKHAHTGPDARSHFDDDAEYRCTVEGCNCADFVGLMQPGPRREL